MSDTLKFEDIISHIPPLPREDLREKVKARVRNRNCSIIVLDDDPTGTQTVHGIPVLTEWSQEVILRELENKIPLFFIMTNSRSLTPDKAKTLAYHIGENIGFASKKANREVLIISRSDSTLRGHYPVEVEGLLEASGDTHAVRFIIPAFFEGGRITFQNVHYVKDQDVMIPAAQTPYAKDPVFGYSFSNLKDYVEEKTGGSVKADQVDSISIDELRNKSVSELKALVKSIEPGSTCIINAAALYDLQKFVMALLDSGINAICRTAASFVSTIAALPPKALLASRLLNENEGTGKLIVLGSHVPKSTRQLNHLLKYGNLYAFELKLKELLFEEGRDERIAEIIDAMNKYMIQDEAVLIYTERTLIKGNNDQENLDISESVSKLVCEIVSGLKQAPRYIIAKGGITSSDVATKSLEIKKAMVLGQVFAGVPVWQAGEESKFPGLPYVVFPGNVGEDDTITRILSGS